MFLFSLFKIYYMLSTHTFIYTLYVKLYYYVPALVFCTSYLLRFFFNFLLTMPISYFGLYAPLLRILDVNNFISIQNYPRAHHECKQRQNNTSPHILYLGTTQGHCSPPSPNHFSPQVPTA
jgi:hypothetical protein